MKTFDELKSGLSRDLAELRKLQANRFTTIEERHTREQEIGRLCYEAEEDLEPYDLNLLKRLLSMSESQWRTYKAICIAGSSPGELP
jgi:hypothetical protein